jgi:shikimate dehydrogenase
MTTRQPQKACVIGWPIKHSRSPLIHGYWLAKHGIPGAYDKREVRPGELSDFVTTLRKGAYVGCNVTIPHKETVAALVDEIDPHAVKAGSLNTLYMEKNRLKATSTDGQGFLQNLMSCQPGYEIAAKPIVILGAGGSARAIANTLAQKGARQIHVQNRTPERATALAVSLGHPVTATTPEDLPAALAVAGLVINTTSAGLTDSDSIDLPWHYLNPQAIIADIVYTPLVTPLLLRARNHGHPIVPGLGMLLHQAVVGFEKWFGLRPEVTPELYDLVARDIVPGYTP